MTSLSVTRWTIFFILLSLPLLFFPFALLAFELPKVTALYVFSALILAELWLGKVHLHKIDWVNFKIERYIPYLLALGFFLWLLVASVFGANLGQSIWGNYFRREGLITWFCYLIIFVASGVAFTNKFMRQNAALAVVISSSTVAFLGVTQFLALSFLNYNSQLLYSGRIISTFGQPNFLGSFLVLSVPFYWYLINNHKSHLFGAFLRISLVLVVLGIIFTFSRSAWLAFLILLFVWGSYNFKLFVGSILSIAFVFIIFAAFNPGVISHEVGRFQVDLSNKWTAENRSLIAARSVDLILKKPISGWGSENFILAFPSVIQNSDLGLKDIVVDSAHNIFLDIAVEGGLVGLVIFLAFIASIFRSGLIKLHSERFPEEKDFTAALLLVVLTFLVAHMFSVLSVVPLVIFWVASGALAGPIFAFTDRRLFPLTGYTLSARVTADALIVLVVFVGWFAIQNLRADSLFHQASYYEVKDINKAISLDNEAINTAPWVQFYTWRKNYLESLIPK